MCGLFGFSKYTDKKYDKLAELTNSLAEQSSVRGTDATGIAFGRMYNLNIIKDSKSAEKITFKHPDDIHALIGHTRHSTQGSEKKNFNNHPFFGRTKNNRFALAHNGVLMNDSELRKELKLPKTKIETDSYIAVQLIESKKSLDSHSLKYMAEKIDGSFSFSVLDDSDNIYLIKGDSPLCILHFPIEEMYVFASTEEILFKAIVDTKLFSALKKGEFEEVKVDCGDILKICSDGTLVYDKFDYNIYNGRHWWDYGFVGRGFSQNDYIDDLKAVAAYQGFSPDDIDVLLKNGFSLEEIESYIYEF